MKDGAFIPQGVPLYVVDHRNRVNMVVGWTPDTKTAAGKWWDPVLVEVATADEGVGGTTVTMGAHEQFLGPDDDGSLAFTPSLDEAFKIAKQFEVWDEQLRPTPPQSTG